MSTRSVIVPIACVAAAFAANAMCPGALVMAAQPAYAVPQQPAAAPAWAHTTRIILLGTDGGPSVESPRHQPSSLLVVDGRPYLIDAGAGVSRELARAGFRTYQVRTIFLTHLHIDHNAGLPAFMAFAWINSSWGKAPPAPGTRPIQIYGPPATKFLVHTALEYLSVSERIFTAGVTTLPPAGPMFQGHDWNVGKQPKVVYQDDRIRVTAVENSHYHFYSGSPQTGQDKSYSYRIDTPAGSVTFTGDTGPEAIPAIAKLAQGTDVLISEIRASFPIRRARGESPLMVRQIRFHMNMEHLSPEYVGTLAAQAHAKLLILTHFVGGLGRSGTVRFTAGVRRKYSGPIIPGMDLFEYDLYK